MKSTDEIREDALKMDHARDHLANERTFLAWIRTSLAIIGLGFVIVKFSLFVKEVELVVSKEMPVRHNSYSLLMGIVLVAIGGIITVVAYLRFNETKKVMQTGRFEQSGWPMKILSVLLVIACVLLIVYLIETT